MGCKPLLSGLILQVYTWNPNDPNDPCRGWKRDEKGLFFGGVDLQEQRSLGFQVYIYILSLHNKMLAQKKLQLQRRP